MKAFQRVIMKHLDLVLTQELLSTLLESRGCCCSQFFGLSPYGYPVITTPPTPSKMVILYFSSAESKAGQQLGTLNWSFCVPSY